MTLIKLHHLIQISLKRNVATFALFYLNTFLCVLGSQILYTLLEIGGIYAGGDKYVLRMRYSDQTKSKAQAKITGSGIWFELTIV